MDSNFDLKSDEMQFAPNYIIHPVTLAPASCIGIILVQSIEKALRKRNITFGHFNILEIFDYNVK